MEDTAETVSSPWLLGSDQESGENSAFAVSPASTLPRDLMSMGVMPSDWTSGVSSTRIHYPVLAFSIILAGGEQGGGGGAARMHWKGRQLQRQPHRRFNKRLEEVAKSVGGGYCRLQMPLKLALAVRET